MAERLRIRHHGTGAYLTIDAPPRVFSINEASTFTIDAETRRLLHRGRPVGWDAAAAVVRAGQAVDGGLYLGENRIVHESEELLTLMPNDTYALHPKDDETAAQLVDVLVIEPLFQAPPSSMSADLVVSVSDMTPTRTVGTAEHRMRWASHALSQAEADLHVLLNIESKGLLSLTRLGAFKNCMEEDASQMASSAAQLALVWDPRKFSCDEALEITQGGGVMARLRSGTSILAIACLRSARDAQQDDALLRYALVTMQRWTDATEHLICTDAIAPMSDRRFFERGWSRITPPRSPMRVFCRKLTGHVLVAADEVVQKNGVALRGQVLGNNYGQTRLLTRHGERRLDARTIARMSHPEWPINPPVICVLHRTREDDGA